MAQVRNIRGSPNQRARENGVVAIASPVKNAETVAHRSARHRACLRHGTTALQTMRRAAEMVSRGVTG